MANKKKVFDRLENLNISNNYKNEIFNLIEDVEKDIEAGELGIDPDNLVTTNTSQDIDSNKNFKYDIHINGKSVIRSTIDAGELKVTHKDSNKGFIIRTNWDNQKGILPAEILTTDGYNSYSYKFPEKSGTIALKEDNSGIRFTGDNVEEEKTYNEIRISTDTSYTRNPIKLSSEGDLSIDRTILIGSDNSSMIQIPQSMIANWTDNYIELKGGSGGVEFKGGLVEEPGVYDYLEISTDYEINSYNPIRLSSKCLYVDRNLLIGTASNCMIRVPEAMVGSNSDTQISLKIGGVINEEIYYNDGSGKLVPIKHPNLSTQPSILPYKFMGQYVYEVLLPVSKENFGKSSYTIDAKFLVNSIKSLHNIAILQAEELLFCNNGSDDYKIPLFRKRLVSINTLELYGGEDLYEFNVYTSSGDITGNIQITNAYLRIVYTSMPEEGDYYGYNSY